MKPLFFPVIDNGMGLSRTSWAISMISALSGRDAILRAISYPYPDGAMNIATQDFLESTADEMVVIDTDLVFQRRDLDWLLEHDEPLVFGIYPKKELGLNYPIQPLPDHPDPFQDPGPLCEMACSARGFMRVHRSVFETLAPLVLRYTDAQTGREQSQFWRTMPGGHSEDFAFCELWRAAGGRILVDKRICLQHEGSAVYPIAGTF